MEQVLIGVAAGLAVTAAGWVGYRRGLKDSAGVRGTTGTDDGNAAQEQDALMKKYEAILDYDPYGERV